MSVTATNYISSSDLEVWMEQKTEELYYNLRSSMDTSNDRAEAEKELNQIKSDLTAAGKSGADPTAIRDEMVATIKKFKDEFPDVAQALQGTLDILNDRIKTANSGAIPQDPVVVTDRSGNQVTIARPAIAPDPAKLTTDEATDWCKTISDCVDGLGKDDQLGMINIQEFNSQINQTKQIASALMDSMDKSANAIISHIS
jgi:hypothetical protein